MIENMNYINILKNIYAGFALSSSEESQEDEDEAEERKRYTNFTKHF